MTTVTQALEELDGVKAVQVNLDEKEAKITYNSETITVAKLIEVIEQTPHKMGADMKYTTKVKQ